MKAPDPGVIRETNLADIAELGFPLPPDNFPLVWEDGDEVELRSRLQLETRVAVLHVILTAVFGAPRELTLGWLERNDLTDALTVDEKQYLETHQGNHDEYSLHLEAEWALAWILGVADELDPTQYAGEGLTNWAPDLSADEPFEQWRLRSPVQIRQPDEVAALLDLHYCLDWGMAQAMRDQTPLPGVTQPYVIGQRRWALEWATVFSGPHHGDPPAWNEVEFGV